MNLAIQRRWVRVRDDRENRNVDRENRNVKVSDNGAVRLVRKPAGFHCARMVFTVHSLTNSSRLLQIPPSEQGLRIIGSPALAKEEDRGQRGGSTLLFFH